MKSSCGAGRGRQRGVHRAARRRRGGRGRHRSAEPLGRARQAAASNVVDCRTGRWPDAADRQTSGERGERSTISSMPVPKISAHDRCIRAVDSSICRSQQRESDLPDAGPGGDSVRDDPRDARHSTRRPASRRIESPLVHGRLAGPLGGARRWWSDTTNLNGRTGVTGNGRNTPFSQSMHLVERFTRVDADTIQYEARSTMPRRGRGRGRSGSR